MKEISVDELNNMIKSKEDIQLIDVRESSEYSSANIGGELIPLQTIPQHIDKISRDKPVIIMCRSGKRSGNAVDYLEQNHNFTNVSNLEGGILDWKAEIDNSLDVE